MSNFITRTRYRGETAKDKCLGPDGFSHNFIVKFFPELKHMLHSIYMKADADGQLPESAMQGVISLMEKLDKNSLYLKNWRPLTMLNCHYKIYAKIMANRLQMVLPYLINEDQCGFMRNRHIASNLTDLLTTIQHCKQNNECAILTSMDYEKAFDTVSWSAMKTVMKAFGFRERFIHLIMLCFRGFKVSIQNNEYETERIELKRGNK